MKMARKKQKNERRKIYANFVCLVSQHERRSDTGSRLKLILSKYYYLILNAEAEELAINSDILLVKYLLEYILFE